MRRKLIGFLTAIAAVAVLVVGGSAIASGAHKHSQPKAPAAQQPARSVDQSQPRSQSEENTVAEERTSSEQSSDEASSESDGDAAAQAAACKAAGIDPNADNVQYDDQSGSCTLDGGSNGSG